MGESSDARRTAHGFRELRKRYVRRAEFLVDDQGFSNGINEFRNSWNALQPKYPIIPRDADRSTHVGAPESLEKAVEMATEARARNKDDGPFPVQWGPVEIAITQWMVAIHVATLMSFPPDDFPNPYQWTLHPASPIVSACVHASRRYPDDPRSFLVDCPRLFREFQLLPEPMRAQHWGGLIGELVSPDPEAITWYIPLYPGITATDIRESAINIARAAEVLFEGHTVKERIRSLRSQGLTFSEIEARLGVGHGTVVSNAKGPKRGRKR